MTYVETLRLSCRRTNIQMNIYICIYYLSFVLQSLSTRYNSNLRVNTGLDSLVPIGFVFYCSVNNTSGQDYEVSLVPDQCCLDLRQDYDCSILEIDGETSEIVGKGTSKMFMLVAPILSPYKRNGHCTIFLNSRQTDSQKSTRDKIKLSFDTRVTNNSMDPPDNLRKCSHIDQDPLNDCRPVDCDSYYNGRRPYFDRKEKRCVKTPNCVDNNALESPGVLYNPDTNQCVERNFVDQRDIEFIKTLADRKERPPKDILIIKNYHYDNDQNDINDANNPTTNPNGKNHKSVAVHKKPKGCKWFKYITTNKYTLSVLTLVVLIQCCLLCTMTYFMAQSCVCFRKKKVVRKYFNYRQDASVTTPLICTSNIDTDTTEFKYMSESSNNIDKKIKCYKACQKERKENLKISMSDDILSKCLNRRDWKRKPQANTIPEIITEKMDFDNMRKILAEEKKRDANKYTDVKVNFESQHQQKVVKAKDSTKQIQKNIEQAEKAVQGEQCSSSEKELQCHSYHYSAKSNLTGFKPSVYNKNFGMFKTSPSKKGTISLSSEKSAQASFSNDSLDDFLSEKGVVYLAENESKYVFSSSSDVKSTPTSVSSRTSKNNVVKNVVSFFSRKSKQPSSDPGDKKSKDNIALELIHMSFASVFSSSNNESECVKGVQRVKDSRTSL